MCIRDSVYPYGAITVGEKGEQLADLRAMASDVIAFTDDGKGVASEDYMRQAMKQAKDPVSYTHLNPDFPAHDPCP